MTQFIEIEGDVARIVERTVTAETTLAALAPHLERHAPGITPIFPWGVGAHTINTATDVDRERMVILIEREPSITAMNVHFDRGQDGQTPQVDLDRGDAHRRATWTLQMPWLYFLFGIRLNTDRTGDYVGLQNFTIDANELYMRPARLKEITDPLWIARIPNVNRAGTICWGSTVHDGVTFAQKLSHMVNEFNDTTFNNHYGIPLPDNFESLTAWEAISDPKNPFSFEKWSHWDRPPDIPNTGDKMRAHLAGGHHERVDYTTMPLPTEYADVIIPEPPQQFTYARIREWMNTVPAAQRERFARTLTEILGETA